MFYPNNDSKSGKTYSTHHSRAEAHEQVLKVPPRGPAHGLSMRTGVVSQALDKLAVTLAQLKSTGVVSGAALPWCLPCPDLVTAAASS